MGVLGVVPGQIGLVQATETLKLILKKGNPMLGKFLVYHALDSDFRTFNVKRNPACPLCGAEPTIRNLTNCYEGTGAIQ